jgi:nicotinamide riboside kinase
MTRGLVIALLGAESTGKSTLAADLSHALQEQTGLRCARVDEYLRAWCEVNQRTPRGVEQREIAIEQHRRIEQAAATHEIVVADTTALMTAVYSHLVWADNSLDAWALQTHAHGIDTTLLTALDLPWVADGLQRDGPQVQVPVDRLLCSLLAEGRIAWARIGGAGPQRLHNALNAVTPALRGRSMARSGLFTRLEQREASWLATPAWQAVCDICDDPHCEQALHRGTLQASANLSPKP